MVLTLYFNTAFLTLHLRCTDDNESSFLSEEDDAGGHSLHALHALQELREEAALAQENEDEDTASKGHEEVKFTPSEVLAATMKRSVSADHALNHHDLHYSGPLSKSPSKEATAYPPHSILKAPEPRPHLIFPFRHRYALHSTVLRYTLYLDDCIV